MEDYKMIKKIDPAVCPHCGKDIYVSSQSMPSIITVINKLEDILEIKRTVKEELMKLSFSNEKDRENIMSWLDEKNTLIDGSDIQPLLKQIQVEQLEKIKSSTKEDEKDTNKI